jgi:PST family polysaccharide transporter
LTAEDSNVSKEAVGEAVAVLPATSPETLAYETPSNDRFLSTDHLQGQLRARSTRGGLATISGQGVQFVVQMAATMILARLLTPQDFGLVGMATVIIGFVGLFKDLGLSQATVQRDEVTQGDVSALFWMNVIASAILMIISMSLAPVLAWFYGDKRLIAITLTLSICFIFSGLGAQQAALLRRQMRFGALVTAELVSMIASIIVAIVFAALGFKYWAIVAQTMTSSALGAIMVWSLSGWVPGKPVFGARVKSMAAFGANLVGFEFCNYFSRNADNFLIGWWWGAASLGLYSKAYTLLVLPLRQINAPVASVAVPMLSRLQNEPERYRRAYRKAIDAVNLVTMPGIGFLLVCADWIIRIVLGPQWLSASRIFIYLGLCAFLQPLANSTGWLFISQGRSRELAQWGVVSSIIIVVSFCIGLPWGPTGVAIAYSCCFLAVIYPVLFGFIGRRGPVNTRDLWGSVVVPGAATLAVIGVVGTIRLLLHGMLPIVGVLICFPIALIAMFATYAAFPDGRRVLAEMLEGLHVVGWRVPKRPTQFIWRMLGTYASWWIVYLNRMMTRFKVRRHVSRFQGRIIDIGAGTSPFRSLFNVDRYVRINALSHADQLRGDSQHTDVWIGSSLPSPFADESFDGAVCFQVLSLISHAETFVADMARVIRPGGHLLLTTDFLYPKWDDADQARRTDVALRSLLERAGFEIIVIEGFGTWKTTFHCILMKYIRDYPSMIGGTSNKARKLVLFSCYLFWLAVLPLLGLLGLLIYFLERNRTDDLIYTTNFMIVARKLH